MFQYRITVTRPEKSLATPITPDEHPAYQLRKVEELRNASFKNI
jgi:hypothetical protein